MPQDDHAIHALLDGSKKGARPALLRAALACVEPLYAGVMRVRNALYRARVLRARSLGRPTISIGNLTTGGTGKTPLVAWLAEALIDTGRHPAILLRGYQSQNGSSDEADELRARLGPFVPVRTDPDRVRGAADLLKHSPASDVLLLDDAFQHRRARRDVDVLVIDATNPFGFDHVLPRGLLREPVRPAIRRAAVVVLTRTDLVTPDTLQDVISRIRRARDTVPIFHTRHALARVRLPGGIDEPPTWLTGRPVGAFCGIGNPISFRTLLERAGADVRVCEVYPDHHAFTPADIQTLESIAKSADVEYLLTTAKDAARLKAANLSPPGLCVAGIELEFEQAHDVELMQLIEKFLQGPPSTVPPTDLP